MTTKEELFATLDEDELNEFLQYQFMPEGWTNVQSDISGYDEGNVTYSYVVKHEETGRYFEFETTYNSWDDYFDQETALADIVEVEPKEVTITKYVPISNS